MIYVDTFDNHMNIFTKAFNSVKTALRYMYAMRGKGIIIAGYRCDDPIDYQWLEKRFRL